MKVGYDTILDCVKTHARIKRKDYPKVVDMPIGTFTTQMDGKSRFLPAIHRLESGGKCLHPDGTTG